MATRTTEKYRIRNYRAMGDEKLERVYDELQNGIAGSLYGVEAYTRCLSRGSGMPQYDLEIVEEIMSERGLL